MGINKTASGDPAIIDLYAGVGGLSLGACRAGFSLRLAVERDKHALAAHRKNFPHSVHADADIGAVSGETILELAGVKPGELAGLIGGPPCQGFSLMGHKDVADPRNGLFRKFFDLVRETRPKFFLAENVPGILTARYTHLLAAAFALVPGDYTVLEPFRVTASDYGVPTIRKRVIFFGYLKSAFPDGFKRSDFDPAEGTAKVTVEAALRGLPTAIKDAWLDDSAGWRVVRSWPEGDFGSKAKGCRPAGVGDAETVGLLRDESRVSGCVATIHTPDVAKRFRGLKAGKVDAISRSTKLDPKGFCPTLRAGTDSDHGSYQALRPVHPTEPRVITPREAARLQGFPDWFRFAPTKWHSFRQIGNSVSPILAEALLRPVRAKIAAAEKLRSKSAA